MSTLRAVHASRPEDTVPVVWRSLGSLYVAGGLLGFASIVGGLRDGAHAEWIATTSAIAVVSGALFVSLARRLPAALLAAMLVAGTLLISTSVLAQGSGTGGYVLFYVWVGIVACNFLSRTQAFVQLAVIASIYAGILAADPGDAPVTEWLMVVGSLLVTWSVINILRRRVDALVAELAQASLADPLTGLLNRRGLQQRMGEQLSRLRRTGEPLALVAVDLDSFKALNDEHGHAHGDAILARFAGVLESMMRGADVAARVGGDEFVILAPDTDLDGALTLAERLRTAAASELSTHARAQTASFGVAVVSDHTADGNALLLAADRALYAAKDGGRNRVVAGSDVAGRPVHTRCEGSQRLR